MLCDAEEERINPVCVNYWVEEGERVIDDITLEYIEEEDLSSKIKIIWMKVSWADIDSFNVSLLQYNDW